MIKYYTKKGFKMFCPKCGKSVSDNMQFCPSCGENLNNYCNPKQQVMENPVEKKVKSKVILAIIISVVVVVLVAIVSVVVHFAISGNSNMKDDLKHISSQTSDEKEKKSLEANGRVQANLSNWGMACEVEDTYYYSDFKTGIYMEGDTVKIADGVYSDLCHLQGKLFCVEYNYDNENDENVYDLVIIDIKTREKIVAYTATGGNYLLISNVIDDKVYFVISDSELVSCDINGNIEYLYIFNVLKATDDGVYTTQHGDYGIQLMSYNNKPIKTFDTLSEKVVSVFFEYDEYVYAKISDEYGESWIPIRINIKTGEYEVIGNVEKQLDYMNYHNDKLYLIYTDNDNETYSIYECDFNGENMMEYSQNVFPEGFTTDLIVVSIVKDMLIQSFPFTSIATQRELLTN